MLQRYAPNVAFLTTLEVVEGEMQMFINSLF